MYVHVPKEKRTKLDIHSHKRILIDYEDMNQYKIWNLTRNDVVVSRDVVFIEEKSINQTSVIYEELRIIHDSIMILSEPSKESVEQLSMSLATEHADSDSDSEESKSDMIDSQILLQESTTNKLQESANEPASEAAIDGSTGESTRTSIRSNKDILTSTKYQDENFDKGARRIRTAKIARNINPNDKDEFATMQEVINHSTREKQ